jgi:hypothetical protein
MVRFSDPFFLAGFLAVLFFVLTGALVGLSLFSLGDRRRRVLRAQSLSLLLQLLLLGWLASGLWGQLAALRVLPEPSVTEIEVWMRRVMTVLLMGIAVVFSSLLTTFAWVRAGSIGNGLRAVVWAIPGVQVVLGAVAVLGLLSTALIKGGEHAIPVGELPAAAEPVLAPLAAIATVWAPVALAISVLSVLVGAGMRSRD